jgi:adenine C2-methylase RlmN of 23S rRNA A2503 and tRNA A37
VTTSAPHKGHLAESAKGNTWAVRQVLRGGQVYKSRHWNYEESVRFVLESKLGVVEASHFTHLDGSTVIKRVVELPTAVGCAIRCRHCASGIIPSSTNLRSDDLVDIYGVVAKQFDDPSDVISLAGIGECSLNREAVFRFCEIMAMQEPRVAFMLTTVGTKPSFVRAVDELAFHANVKVLQISLYHATPRKLVSLLGPAFAYFDLDELVYEVARASAVKVRFNYVVIDGLNDDQEAVYSIISKLLPLRERVVIRVARLNETTVSIGNGLKQTSVKTVEEIALRFNECGFQTYIFMSSYNDNMNCGQLAWNGYLESRQPGRSGVRRSERPADWVR